MAVPDMFNRKRMLAAAAGIVIVTVVTVTLRSHWSYTAQLQQQLLTHKAKANSSCGKLEAQPLQRCEKCPREELRNEVSYCMETGFKQWVQCSDGKKLYNWCDMTPADEERQFWIFEFCALVITAASYTVVYVRQRKNDQLMMEKINRQIGLSA